MLGELRAAGFPWQNCVRSTSDAPWQNRYSNKAFLSPWTGRDVVREMKEKERATGPSESERACWYQRT